MRKSSRLSSPGSSCSLAYTNSPRRAFPIADDQRCAIAGQLFGAWNRRRWRHRLLDDMLVEQRLHGFVSLVLRGAAGLVEPGFGGSGADGQRRVHPIDVV